jgi:hypothetical protein
MEDCPNINVCKIERIRDVVSGYKEGFLIEDSMLQMIEFILKGNDFHIEPLG